MGETGTDEGTIAGTTLQTIGGVVLALTVAVSLWLFSSGDPVTGGVLLIYLPVALLLFGIGREADLV